MQTNAYIIGIFIAVIFTFAIMCALFLATADIFYKYIYLSYKKKSTVAPVEDLYQTLAIIISNEISLYERSIFEHGGKIVTNATFDNYYRDICQRIHDSLSEELMTQFSFYLTKEAVYKIISRTVKNYLQEKIL